MPTKPTNHSGPSLHTDAQFRHTDAIDALVPGRPRRNSGLPTMDRVTGRTVSTPYQPAVHELIGLLATRPDLQMALEQSIRAAAEPGIESTADYYGFLNHMVTLIPNDRNLGALLFKFYFLVDQSPGSVLQNDPAFQSWLCRFAADWGAYLDTPASAAGIDSFLSDPAFHMDEYAESPSGWLTFNQFFARQVRPGARPIAEPHDDRVLVSPADAVYMGQWPIRDDSTITTKGFTWSVLDLLAGSPFQERFKGGVFTHSFLDVNDYHRFHVPVGGVVREIKKIPGRVAMDVYRGADGVLAGFDGTGYQFMQDRGLIVLETAIGLAAVLPIGMAQVSSVNLTARVGAVLAKGEEFGFFAFGGSDIVTLFEADRVHLEAVVGQHYKQGERIGHA